MICNACHLPPQERAALDAALLAEEPLLAVAKRHGLAESSLRRHRDSHLQAGQAEPASAAQEDETIRQLAMLQDSTKRILDSALADKGEGGPEGYKPELALRAVREAAKLLRQAVDLSKQLQRGRVTAEADLRLSSQWGALVDLVARTLRPWPDARRAVADAIARERRRKSARGVVKN